MGCLLPDGAGFVMIQAETGLADGNIFRERQVPQERHPLKLGVR